MARPIHPNRRPKSRREKEKVSASQKARYQKIREALAIADTVAKTGVFVAADDRQEPSCEK